MAKKSRTEPTVLMLPAPSLRRSGWRIWMLSLWLRSRRAATPVRLAAIALGVYLLLSTAYSVVFFWPRSIAFSFAEENCLTSPTLLPNLIAKHQGTTFSAIPQSTVSIGSYPLYSHTTCIEPTQAPDAEIADTIRLNPLGIGLLAKRIGVSTNSLPTVAHQAVLSSPVSAKEPLVLPLSEHDRVFSYRLAANAQVADCTVRDQSLVCDTATLQLEQSANYIFVLQRFFNDAFHQTAFEQSATTVGAVQLASSSVTAGQTIFDVPTELTLTFNKEIKKFDGVELSLLSGDTRQAIRADTRAEGNTLTITLKEPLARSGSFELTVGSVSAPDGGHLPQPLTLPFATSGGPKVQSVSIGTYKVATGSNVTITLDAPASASQNLDEFIKLEANGNAIAANISTSGNRITINPVSDLPGCAHLTVKVLDGLQNEHGISGGSAWSYSSRVICQNTFSIGSSVQKRGITGYRFGSGSSTIVFVGTTHGDEKSSTATLNSWVDYLERHYDTIPAHRTVVVIPNINPDAYNADKRTNANDVDLNRNFPANNWKQGVIMPGGSFNANGGGHTPLSEPESAAIASYILGINPRLVLTYHAAAGVVIPNDSGDSDALAKIYDQKSNLYYEPNSQTGAIFQYDTTGSMEEWLYDKHGIPTILVELWTKTSNEFAKNQNAMLHMVTLP